MNEVQRACGFNPIVWDCKKRGCFNTKCRPKIELFAKIWPNKISMGDQDGVVEINRRFLYLEWKSSFDRPIPRGQDIMFRRRTEDGCSVVFCVVGNAETMEITHYKIYWRGKDHPWTIAGFEDLYRRWERWCEWALGAKSRAQ